MPPHSSQAATWQLAPGKRLDLNLPRILAIINVTPDSFSDGGLHESPDAAAAAAAAAIVAGADVIDVGGESTRPGSARVSAADQIARVVPALRAIRARIGAQIPITIDTTLSPVAIAALDVGADAINDVSAGLDDAGMLPLAAERRCGVILMHRLAPPERDEYSDRYTTPPVYDDVVETVADFLHDRALAAERAGVAREAIVLDPGLGFGKSVEQNLTLIRETSHLTHLGHPILSGLSRKSFVAKSAGLRPDSPPAARVAASVALSLVHHLAGARLFRVHDVREHAQALRPLMPPATGASPERS